MSQTLSQEELHNQTEPQDVGGQNALCSEWLCSSGFCLLLFPLCYSILRTHCRSRKKGASVVSPKVTTFLESTIGGGNDLFVDKFSPVTSEDTTELSPLPTEETATKTQTELQSFLKLSSQLEAERVSTQLPTEACKQMDNGNADSNVVGQRTDNSTIFAGEIWHYSLWFAFVTLLFVAIRCAVQLLNLRRRRKNAVQSMTDWCQLILLHALVFHFGNVKLRVVVPCKVQPPAAGIGTVVQKKSDTSSKTVPNYNFVLRVFVNAAIYMCTFEACPTNLQLSGRLLQLGTASVLLPLFVTLCVAVYTTVLTLKYHWKDTDANERSAYFLALFAFVLFHVLLWIICAATGTPLHVHHYWWSFWLSLFCRVPRNRIAIAVQSLLIAITIHGVAVFGPESLFV